MSASHEVVYLIAAVSLGGSINAAKRSLGAKEGCQDMNVATVPVVWLGALYVAFTIKHLLADFIFQTNWMAQGKTQAQGWLAPLAAHAGIHALLTLLLALALLPSLWWLGLVDFVVHTIIDRGKALATRGLGLHETDNAWWWLLGLDQALHALTHFSFVLALLLAR
jgi:hypothetical protein